MFVIGKRDMEADAVSTCVHDKGNLGDGPRAEVIADLLRAVARAGVPRPNGTA